jgi:serine/threonine-protein kinase
VEPEIGEALGASYRFVDRIGSGAAGEVWRVRDVRDESLRAAKVLRREHAQDADLVERFIRERTVLTRLRDPHVVAVRDLVVEGERLAIIMDLVEGGSLRQALDERGTLPPAEAVALTAAVLDALAAAHAVGTVHRDIKPDNVLLDRDARDGDDPGAAVRVVDFGIARVLDERRRSTTAVIGTPEYMSPELVTIGEAGPPSDVYASGILLYELLSGRTPFAGPGTDFTVAYRHVSAEVPPLDVPDDLWRVLARLLAKAPADRPSAAEAATTLRRLRGSVAELAALTPVAAPEGFAEAERPATVLRGVAPTGPEPVAVPSDEPAPDLGAASQATVLRPMPRREAPQPVEAETETKTSLWTRMPRGRALWIAGAAVVAVAAVAAFFLFRPPAGEAAPAAAGPVVTSSQQDRALPTGLSVSRSVSYDPEKKLATVTIEYGAQNAPLGGPFLEVLPGAAESDACPAVTWSDATVDRNQASVTGISVPCGWSVDGLTVPTQDSVTVTAQVSIALNGQEAVDAWLKAAAAATTKAISDSEVSGAAYPVQRLRSVQVTTPSRTVGGTALPVTLLPVWPSGPDPVNPLFTSPSVGEPSAMLDAVAGGTSGVRFSDGCAGALTVSSDGLVVTALSVAPDCTVRARVGNFTDLVSPPFGITTR